MEFKWLTRRSLRRSQAILGSNQLDVYIYIMLTIFKGKGNIFYLFHKLPNTQNPIGLDSSRSQMPCSLLIILEISDAVVYLFPKLPSGSPWGCALHTRRDFTKYLPMQSERPSVLQLVECTFRINLASRCLHMYSYNLRCKRRYRGLVGMKGTQIWLNMWKYTICSVF